MKQLLSVTPTQIRRENESHKQEGETESKLKRRLSKSVSLLKTETQYKIKSILSKSFNTPSAICFFLP